MENVVEIQLSERFEVAFNQIHNWLQKNIKDSRTDKFTELLRLGFSGAGERIEANCARAQ